MNENRDFSTVALFLASVIVIVIAFLYAQFHPDVCSGGSLGTYISGVASAVGFIWLVSGYRSQKAELKLQREELQAQRETVALQKEEIGKIAESNTINLIAKILDDFKNDLGKISFKTYMVQTNETRGKTPRDLLKLFSNNLDPMCIHLATKPDKINNGQIQDFRGKWLPIENACQNFLETFLTALDLYFAAITNSTPLDRTDISHELELLPEIEQFPFIQQYYPLAKRLAKDMKETAAIRGRAKLTYLLKLRDEIQTGENEQEINSLTERFGDIPIDTLIEDFERFKKVKNNREPL